MLNSQISRGGIGDACDSDDGDGVSDLREIKVGTDPLDASLQAFHSLRPCEQLLRLGQLG